MQRLARESHLMLPLRRYALLALLIGDAYTYTPFQLQAAFPGVTRTVLSTMDMNAIIQQSSGKRIVATLETHCG